MSGVRRRRVMTSACLHHQRLRLSWSVNLCCCAATQTVIWKTQRRTTSCRDATESNAIAHNSLTDSLVASKVGQPGRAAGDSPLTVGEGKGDEQCTTGAGKASLLSVGNRNVRGGRYSQATKKKRTSCYVRYWRNTAATVWFSM